MDDLGNQRGLPMMSEKDMLNLLLSTNSELGESEPEIAASIGEQMLHMDLSPLPKSLRVRIRDICSRVPSGNTILIGGGIGHLAAWLFDLWGMTSKEEIVGSYEGEDLIIGYNGEYLKDVISHVSGDIVVIKLNTPISATLFIGENEETEKTMLLMPVRLNS